MLTDCTRSSLSSATFFACCKCHREQHTQQFNDPTFQVNLACLVVHENAMGRLMQKIQAEKHIRLTISMTWQQQHAVAIFAEKIIRLQCVIYTTIILPSIKPVKMLQYFYLLYTCSTKVLSQYSSIFLTLRKNLSKTTNWRDTMTVVFLRS